MKKILLVSPDFNPRDSRTVHTHFSNKWLSEIPFLSIKAYMVPLSLATICALTPEEFEVDIWDEGVHGTIYDVDQLGKQYDLVGVTGYVSHTRRIRELGVMFREQGILTAVGGPDVSGSPENYKDYFDILFVGEAEFTWKQFLTDWQEGNWRSEYRQVQKPPMASSPVPKWDKIVPYMGSYAVAAVQTTRGCPFDCDYCDVVYIFGRDPRHKSIEQVIDEVRTLQYLGVGSIFFCDDNFMGAPKYAKDLLRALIPVNREFSRPIGFTTQITLNVAQDEELLQLLADANFTSMFIGIETPNEESLKGANKKHNLRGDILESVKKIHSYGIVVEAGIMVGFDQDDTSIFERQQKFAQESGIDPSTINTLKAPPGTKLWYQMHREGRVVRPRDVTDHEAEIGSDVLTNIIPKNMTRIELISGCAELIEKMRDWHNFGERTERMLSRMPRHESITKERSGGSSLWGLLGSVPSALKALLSMDAKTRSIAFFFVRNMFLKHPNMIGKMIKLSDRERQKEISKIAHQQFNLGNASDDIKPINALRFFFSIDREARCVILRLVLDLLLERPYTMGRVAGLIGRQYIFAAQLPELKKIVREQILLEEDDDYLEIEDAVYSVPEEFKAPFIEVFPKMYAQVHARLNDKSRTLNVLVEATYDFLTRWSSTFKKFEDYHEENLLMSCERAAAGENNEPGNVSELVALAINPEEIPDDDELKGLTRGKARVKLERFANEVLRNTGQQLRHFQPTEATEVVEVN